MNRSKLSETKTHMKDYESQSHTKWYCVYHIVFIPKYPRKRLFREIREHVGEVLHDLA